MSTENSKTLPVNIVGSSVFGRYPKISSERTYNMFISDNWLVNYAGFQKELEFSPEGGEGRGLFHSIRGNFLVAVIDSSVYKITDSFAPQFIDDLETVTGEVVMDENLSGQILIVDGQFAYVYYYADDSLTKQNLGFSPQYVAYHNTFFLLTPSPSDINPQQWYVYQKKTLSNTEIEEVTTLELQTKPDTAMAVHRIPGKANNIIVLGKTVAEIWTNIGGAQNYSRVSSYNIDNGVFSINTVSSSDDYVCWLAQNEKNTPSIMLTDGGSTKKISTDGIDLLLQELVRPDLSTASFYRQDGHLFYQLTFYGNDDNLSLIYDFNTDKFFHITDEDLNYYPARRIVNFNNDTYFVSLNEASLYKMGSNILSYNYSTEDDSIGEIIPRKRISNTIRSENGSPFRANTFGFILEQGVTDFSSADLNVDEYCTGNIVTEDVGDEIITEDGSMILTEDGFCLVNANLPRIDLSLSKDGNIAFGNKVSKNLNTQANYRNRLRWQNMGHANEITFQLDFWGLQRFVIQQGYVETF